jgi:ankyrin repeat protein
MSIDVVFSFNEDTRMSKKDLLNAIEVKSPCGESWDEMQGNETVRFCSHCSKNVNDLSKMTRKDALRLVRRSGGNLCVRYAQHPVTQKPLFAENLYKITRRATSLAAGVMTASITLSTAAYAQGGALRQQEPANEKAVQETRSSNEKKAAPPATRFWGTATDANGAFVSGARVNLKNDITGRETTTVTDENGRYEITNLPEARYTFTVSANGFEQHTSESVEISGEVRRDALLSAPAVSIKPTRILGGAIAVRIVRVQSALAAAVQNEDLKLVRRLLNRGADVNEQEKDYSDRTPLFFAVESGNAGIAKMLIDFGAEVNARDLYSQTPIMNLDDDSSSELVKLLIAHGATVDLTDDSDNTALILAAEDEAEPSVIKALIDAGANVNQQNSEGYTALIKAAENDEPDTVRLLLESGAGVNYQNADGDTALMMAADGDAPEIIRMLIEAGADTGLQDESGNTALLVAANNDDLESVRALLLGGADVNHKNSEGETAWDLSADADVIKLIESFGGISGNIGDNDDDAAQDN